MQYLSTRDSSVRVDFAHTLASGLAADGGLYLPLALPPAPTADDMTALASAPYAQVAAAICAQFIGDFAPPTPPAPERAANRADAPPASGELLASLRHVYSGFSDAEVVTPLRQIGDGTYLLETFHGPTLSFKDIAMQLLGSWMPGLLAASRREALVIGATSGDTGAAAVEAFAGKRGVVLVILHPNGRISPAQRRQMTTCVADNVHNIALDGSFDDCQSIVKQLYRDESLARGRLVTGVNSVNFARIMAQSVYYAAVSSKLLATSGKKTDFVVPSGNFGNAFAAHMARAMGWPVGSIILATNANDILYRTWQTGVMEPEAVIPTLSPAMDIQISSNFERFIYMVSGGDADLVVELMNQLRTAGRVSLPPLVHEGMRACFFAQRASDEQTEAAMALTHAETGIIIDPHTATGIHALGAYTRQNGALRNNRVVVATAHPAKFSGVIERVLGRQAEVPPRLEACLTGEERYQVLPADFSAVRQHIAGLGG